MVIKEERKEIGSIKWLKSLYNKNKNGKGYYSKIRKIE